MRELQEPDETHTAGSWPSPASDTGLLTLKLMLFPLNVTNMVFCYCKLTGRQVCPFCRTPLMRGLICCQVPKCKGFIASSPRSSWKVRVLRVCQCWSRGTLGPNQGLHSSSFREKSCPPADFTLTGMPPKPPFLEDYVRVMYQGGKSSEPRSISEIAEKHSEMTFRPGKGEPATSQREEVPGAEREAAGLLCRRAWSQKGSPASATGDGGSAARSRRRVSRGREEAGATPARLPPGLLHTQGSPARSQPLRTPLGAAAGINEPLAHRARPLPASACWGPPVGPLSYSAGAITLFFFHLPSEHCAFLETFNLGWGA